VTGCGRTSWGFPRTFPIVVFLGLLFTPSGFLETVPFVRETGGVVARFLGETGGVVARFLGETGGVVARFLGETGGVTARCLGETGGVAARCLVGVVLGEDL
jgi:hypothetical protein